MENAEFDVEIYHSKENIEDECYLPFRAICYYDELQKIMEIALMRGYYMLISVHVEDDK